MLGSPQGLLRWVISSHTGTSPKEGITIAPQKKLRKQPKEAAVVEPDAPTPPTPVPAADASALPPLPNPLAAGESEDDPLLSTLDRQLQAQVSQIPPGAEGHSGGLIADHPIEPPPGVTLSALKARLNGSKIKGQYLTPEEMHFLTRSWRPYRSLGE